MITRFAAAVAVITALAPLPVSAQNQGVALTTRMLVARSVTDASGKKVNKLFELKNVSPGDALVIINEYRNTGTRPAVGFVIDNPIPPAVNFTGVEQSWATVSVDNGRTFGGMATAKVIGADGKPRAAVPGDVTHLKWRFAQPIPAGGTGKVMFYGTVK